MPLKVGDLPFGMLAAERSFIHRDTNKMSPIDPVRKGDPSPPAPMAPFLADDNLELGEVEAGMEAAENDTRDALVDIYVNDALISEDPEEALDDIDYSLSDGAAVPPELDAIHGDQMEDLGDEDFENEEE
jgi:hypothetical protein